VLSLLISRKKRKRISKDRQALESLQQDRLTLRRDNSFQTPPRSPLHAEDIAEPSSSEGTQIAEFPRKTTSFFMKSM
jgi:hypothetical protein